MQCMLIGFQTPARVQIANTENLLMPIIHAMAIMVQGSFLHELYTHTPQKNWEINLKSATAHFRSMSACGRCCSV